MNYNRTSGGWKSIPPVTMNLIIINVLVWLVEFIFPSMGDKIVNFLGLHYWGAERFNPLQVVTYMFVHDNGGITHIFFNMFSLYMFGRLMEMVWGSRRFLIYYMVCGVGAAAIQEIVWHFTYMQEYISNLAPLNNISVGEMASVVKHAIAVHDVEFINAIESYKNMIVCVGASGAVFGILLGFAFVFPNIPLYLFFIPVPIKAKYMVIGYAVLEFFLGVTPGVGGTVAHFAHLGGMIFGLVLLLIWKKKGTLNGRIIR